MLVYAQLYFQISYINEARARIFCSGERCSLEFHVRESESRQVIVEFIRI